MRTPIHPDLVELYRKTFNSIHGQKVLMHMLFEMGFSSEGRPEDLPLNNYAKRLVGILGGGKGIEDITMKNFIENLCRQPITEAKKDDWRG